MEENTTSIHKNNKKISVADLNPGLWNISSQ